MEVFDAVRPELKLAQSFPVQTIPLDTIKAVVKREGLVSEVNYRPSRQRKIRHRMKQMNKPQFKAFLEATKLDLTQTESLPEVPLVVAAATCGKIPLCPRHAIEPKPQPVLSIA